MQYKAASLLLFAALCVTTKSDSDIDTDDCDISRSMQGKWTVLSDDLQNTNDTVVVDGNNIEVTTDWVTRAFKCIDKGLFYGEYLWISNDIPDNFLCVLKTDVGRNIFQRMIKTHTGNFNPEEIPEKTDHEYLNLCSDEFVSGGLKLKRGNKNHR
ncbi:uncharacterized protein LOC110454870 [Mizuhopecten yessoensis]|uniref:Uncharacterized protein n=1 Tax=Mizuhopecten yessoensis TaxID=6573 RepID=A0A210QED5_MIZYE|nr:uncharacterized protein LOC110454870 [Mizuhopecten yessoensis]OWF47089.1 hypothetical protein KP79_PYT12576 [Mizuhopecten yessoensis]